MVLIYTSCEVPCLLVLYGVEFVSFGLLCYFVFTVVALRRCCCCVWVAGFYVGLMIGVESLGGLLSVVSRLILW